VVRVGGDHRDMMYEPLVSHLGDAVTRSVHELSGSGTA
jgi:thioesterase domain-containing protein